MINKKETAKDFEKAVVDSFGNLVKYSFFAGSFCYSEDTSSDIDVLVLLRQEANNLPQSRINSMRDKFNRLYLEIHKRHKRRPDRVFPGEVICESMLDEVKRGRGFKFKQGMPRYDAISGLDEEWIKNPSLEYRCWRSMYFFTNPEHLFQGDPALFDRDRKGVLFPFILYLLSNAQINGESLEFEKIEERLIRYIKSTKKQNFGYRDIYKSSLFRDDHINGVPIMDILSERKILSEGRYCQREFVRSQDLMGLLIRGLPEGVQPNKFLRPLK
jgi:hypothetical protein